MLQNIGGKTKKLSTIFCYLGLVAAVVAAINCWKGNYCADQTILLMAAVLAVLAVACWFKSFFCYGFGVLLENSEKQTIYLKHMLNGGTGEPVVENKPLDKQLLRKKISDVMFTVSIIVVSTFVIWILLT